MRLFGVGESGGSQREWRLTEGQNCRMGMAGGG